jgi:hypothetical protein
MRGHSTSWRGECAPCNLLWLLPSHEHHLLLHPIHHNRHREQGGGINHNAGIFIALSLNMSWAFLKALLQNSKHFLKTHIIHCVVLVAEFS